MQIVELHTFTSSQVNDLQTLMHELAPDISVTVEMLERAAKAPGTHLFAAVDGPVPELAEGLDTATGRIIGCASLCVFHSRRAGRRASRMSW